MAETLKIALAQLDFLVGDVRGNAAKVIASARHARRELGADLVLYPELTLSGYPPEDLLFHRGFRRQIEAGLAQLRAELEDARVLIGFPEYAGAGIYNSAALITGGEIGGSDEESAARYIRRFVSKPVVAYVAGVTAPPGKRMGHAGAIVAGGQGTAADKYAAFEDAGVRTVKSPAELGSAMNALLRRPRDRARPATGRPGTRAKPAKPAAERPRRPRGPAGRRSARKVSRPARGRRR